MLSLRTSRARAIQIRAARAGAALAGLGLAAGLLAGCGGSSQPAAVNANGGGIMHVTGSGGPSQNDSHYPGAIITPTGAHKPVVTLTDTSGQPYNLERATAGKVAVVYFGYTHCPDVCPINMALAGATLSRLSPSVRDKVTVVFITTDPRRDTPKVIRAWLDNFSDGHRMVGLTGSSAQIHQAEKQVGMPLSFVEAKPAHSAKGYIVSHSGYLLAYSQDNLAHLQFYDNEQAQNFATSLTNLVKHGFER